MQQPEAQPQLVTLEPVLLCGLRAQGDDSGSEAHWRRFRSWLDANGVESCDPHVLAVAYNPPLPFGALRTVELCVPVASALQLEDGDFILRTLGGRFVLAGGDPMCAAELLRTARAFASAHGLPFERGSIAIYRPAHGGEKVHIDAGVRIHD